MNFYPKNKTYVLGASENLCDDHNSIEAILKDLTTSLKKQK